MAGAMVIPACGSTALAGTTAEGCAPRHNAPTAGGLLGRHKMADQMLRLSSRYRCICISWSIGIMAWFKLAMIIIDPNTTSPTMKMPNASARKLLV
jgi:hypothetical protein